MIDDALVRELLELEQYVAEFPSTANYYRHGMTLEAFEARLRCRRRSIRKGLDRLTAAGTVTRAGDRWRIADLGAPVAYDSDRSSSPA